MAASLLPIDVDLKVHFVNWTLVLWEAFLNSDKNDQDTDWNLKNAWPFCAVFCLCPGSSIGKLEFCQVVHQENSCYHFLAFACHTGWRRLESASIFRNPFIQLIFQFDGKRDNSCCCEIDFIHIFNAQINNQLCCLPAIFPTFFLLVPLTCTLFVIRSAP